MTNDQEERHPDVEDLEHEAVDCEDEAEPLGDEEMGVVDTPDEEVADG